MREGLFEGGEEVVGGCGCAGLVGWGCGCVVYGVGGVGVDEGLADLDTGCEGWGSCEYEIWEEDDGDEGIGEKHCRVEWLVGNFWYCWSKRLVLCDNVGWRKVTWL